MTTNLNVPAGTPEWEVSIAKEVARFVQATMENLEKGMNGTMSFLPKDAKGEIAPQDLAKQRQHFFAGMINAVVGAVGRYEGLQAESEVQVITGIQKYFSIFRDMQAKEQTRAEIAKSVKLVQPNGLAIGEKPKLITPQGKEI
jgi:hypothetical protein